MKYLNLSVCCHVQKLIAKNIVQIVNLKLWAAKKVIAISKRNKNFGVNLNKFH